MHVLSLVEHVYIFLNSSQADRLFFHIVDSHATSQPETVGQLENRLAAAQKRIDDLEAAYHEQSQIVIEYENGMHDTTSRLRNYMYEQQRATIGVYLVSHLARPGLMLIGSNSAACTLQHPPHLIT